MLNAVQPGSITVDAATVVVHPDTAAMARAAADEACAVLRAAVEARGVAHAMFATGNSQLAFVQALVHETQGVPWADTVVFHMDEYVGVGPDHPAGFQKLDPRADRGTGAAQGGLLRRGLGRPRGQSARATPACCGSTRSTCAASGSGRTAIWPSTTRPWPTSPTRST